LNGNLEHAVENPKREGHRNYDRTASTAIESSTVASDENDETVTVSNPIITSVQQATAAATQNPA
jgi:hypothetical protein